MTFRITTYLVASLVGALCSLLWGGWRLAGLFAWMGASVWFVIDVWHGQHLLTVLRDGVMPESGSVGIWSELSNRIRKQLRVRDQQIAQTENRLQEFLQAIQASPNGVVLMDEEGRIEWCNATASEQLGIDAQRDLQQHLANLVRDPVFVTYLSSWNYSREVLMDAPVRQIGKRGPLVRLSVQVHPYAGSRRLLLTRDVTAIEQADAMRRDFVANVSHEIRTPLTVLAGFVETMQNIELDGQERRRYLSLMAQQSHRMETLVNDLLALSRIEGSITPSANQWTPLRVLLKQVEEEGRGLSRRLWEQGQRLYFELGDDGEIAGVSTELQSAMSNLLSNAVRYTPVGGEIRVSWRRLPDGRGEFMVRDSGPGIAAEHIPRLTERFYRVDRSRSRETGGTGLGLAIVKHVVQRHGGELRIESTLSKGSCFTLLFPALRIRHSQSQSIAA